MDWLYFFGILRMCIPPASWYSVEYCLLNSNCSSGRKHNSWVYFSNPLSTILSCSLLATSWLVDSFVSSSMSSGNRSVLASPWWYLFCEPLQLAIWDAIISWCFLQFCKLNDSSVFVRGCMPETLNELCCSSLFPNFFFDVFASYCRSTMSAKVWTFFSRYGLSLALYGLRALIFGPSSAVISKTILLKVQLFQVYSPSLVEVKS